MDRRFEDRVAVVTAAGSGMGRAIAHRLAAEGATTWVVDLDAEAADRTAGEIEAAGGAAESVAADASQVADLESLFESVRRRHGVLHVLHNQVGIPGAPGIDFSEEEWHRVNDINTKSAFFGTRIATPLLAEAGRASVTFTASTSALVGSPYSPLYSITKFAVIGFMKSYALAVASQGIRSNAICPGPVDTPMLDTFFRLDDPVEREERKKQFFTTVPLGRACTPEEIGAAIAFLASDEAGFITGAALPIDGGITVG